MIKLEDWLEKLSQILFLMKIYIKFNSIAFYMQYTESHKITIFIGQMHWVPEISVGIDR